jgi:hypothetical protein
LLVLWTLEIGAHFFALVGMSVKTYEEASLYYRTFIAVLIVWTILMGWTLGTFFLRAWLDWRQSASDQAVIKTVLPVAYFWLLVVSTTQLGFHAYKHAVHDIHDQLPGERDLYDDAASQTTVAWTLGYLMTWLILFVVLEHTKPPKAVKKRPPPPAPSQSLSVELLEHKTPLLLAPPKREKVHTLAASL